MPLVHVVAGDIKVSDQNKTLKALEMFSVHIVSDLTSAPGKI